MLPDYLPSTLAPEPAVYSILTPGIDEPVSSQELAAAERLVQAELASFPRRRQNAPEAPSNSLLMQEVQRYEQGAENGSVPDSILAPAIDLRRYHEFVPESPDFDAMYTSLSYAVLRERSSRLQLQSVDEMADAARQLHAGMAKVVDSQEAEIGKKRAALQELQSLRWSKQQKFAPVQSHLEQRWKNGLRALVDRCMQDE